MKQSRLLAVVLGLTVAFGSATLVPASAVAPKDGIANCDLDGLLKQLAAVKQDGTTTSDDVELDLRKQILVRSMDCNAREASSFADVIANVETQSRAGISLKKRYESGLRDAASFAAKQSRDAANLATVSATKELAQSLKVWRIETYNPLTWEAAQLVILDRNLDLADSAADRVAQLTSSLDAAGDVQGAAEVREEVGQAASLVKDATDKLNGSLTQLR
ncbi:MAG: hypothetical protein IT514_15970, partial [Burkholderiales bacterium]|nr:hypothetical protein [Burkholderiales bacterium]